MKLKVFLFIALLFVVNHANSAPLVGIKNPIEVTKQSFNKILNKGYNFFYSLSDGQNREESASFDDDVLRVKGSYSFKGDDNKKYRVDYTADENGYQARKEVEEEIITVIHSPPPPEISAAALATLTAG